MAIKTRYKDKNGEPIYIGGSCYGEIEREEISKPIEKSFFNCPNCCAPVVKEYCEYCGTRFGFKIKKVDQAPIRENPFKQFQETAYNFGCDAPKLPLKMQR